MMHVEDAMQVLKEHGYKYTDKRQDMILVFSANNKYLSARDVLEYMKADYPGLSFDTIYRNLSLFADLGILEQTELEGEKHFRSKCKTTSHHHHFICLECGKTKTIETCPMHDISDNFQGFEVTGHKFEVYGKCPECVVL
ncbi:Fur family zinc uptake transcriptional regulator [Priestia taiwanensis]|nr:Fur family zinc uptake transcriptional regulator [Priestia taiwanensis]